MGIYLLLVQEQAFAEVGTQNIARLPLQTNYMA
jgi:hypothetical protein